MLTDKTRLRPKDKPLADLAIKTLAMCRSLYADAYALLPQQTRVEVQALNLEQDSLLAQLYVSKITTGEYNVGMNRISAKMLHAIWGDVHPAAPNDSAKQVVKAPATQTVQQQLQTAQPKISNETRLALVIGNSKYTELPKLKNKPGMVGWSARNIVCHQEIGTPLVSKRQLGEMKFPLLSSMAAGDGEIFFKTSQTRQDVSDQKGVIVIFRNNADHNVQEFFPAGTSIPDPPSFRTEVDHVLLKCNESKSAIVVTEQWS
jgi:hypothetical protein